MGCGAGGALGGPAQAPPRPGCAEEQLHPCSPRPGSPCSCNNLGSHEFESQGEMPNFGSELPLPALCSRQDLLGFSVISVPSARVSVISVFVFGCLAVSPSSPILLPREETPEVACPLLSHTHTHSLSLSLSPSPSLSSLQTQLWSSATTAAGKTCPCPPTPAASPALFSLHQPGTPQFPEGPPAMSDPDIRRGPDVPAMWPPCSRGA